VTPGVPVIYELGTADADALFSQEGRAFSETQPTVADLLPIFAACPGLVVFDSAKTSAQLGRYSVLAADPVRTFELREPRFGLDPLAEIREAMAEFQTEPVAGLPPFQGGAAGILSYELGRCFEQLPTVMYDELQIPCLAVGIYDWVIAWDHQQGRCWLISQGFSEVDQTQRSRRAQERAEWVLTMIRKGAPRRESAKFGAATLSPDIPKAPQHTAPGPAGLLSNFTRQNYLAAVERVIEYIRAGDIFQANLAQRLVYSSDESPLDLYLRLRQRNPAPFGGCFFRDDWAVLSASPERFIQLNQGVAETRPIKGTRRRPNDPQVDLFTADELRESEKDVAENLMIVDLLRNDLSRVCRPGSIRVPQLCEVENYETVQHLVSVVQGELHPGRDAWDLLKATFPGGSITGAPKVRAMEIISELEQVARGPYCGSLFYVGFDGRSDSSILIRTFVVRRGWVQCSVGGGVTVKSDALAEYNETLHKAAGMLRVWEGTR
jgi:para-aminobenzoate synthetase component 1